MKRFLCCFLTLTLICGLLTGCTAKDNSGVTSAVKEDNTVIRIIGMTGPTSLGLVKLVSDGNTEKEKYDFSVVGSADAITPKLIKGEVDIAALPANLASALYNKTDGKIKLLAVNTLGVLYITENGNSVTDIKSLKGKTVYATGKGAVPEYVLRYILSKNGLSLDTDVTVEWKSEPAEVVALLKQNAGGIAMLPEPFVTVAKASLPELKTAISLNDEWEKSGDGSVCITGVLVVRTEFADAHKDLLSKFLSEYEKSVKFAKENAKDVAMLSEKYGIVKSQIAEKAIPYCNLTFIEGKKAKEATEKYLNMLFGINPSSVGGKLPGEEFYYESK